MKIKKLVGYFGAFVGGFVAAVAAGLACVKFVFSHTNGIAIKNFKNFLIEMLGGERSTWRRPYNMYRTFRSDRTMDEEAAEICELVKRAVWTTMGVNYINDQIDDYGCVTLKEVMEVFGISERDFTASTMCNYGWKETFVDPMSLKAPVRL